VVVEVLVEVVEVTVVVDVVVLQTITPSKDRSGLHVNVEGPPK